MRGHSPISGGAAERWRKGGRLHSTKKEEQGAQSVEEREGGDLKRARKLALEVGSSGVKVEGHRAASKGRLKMD